MNAAEKRTKATVEEYFAYEATIIGKAEYYDGRIYNMSGGTINHSLIATNLSGSLFARLEGTGCRAHNGDLKIAIASEEAYVYPDCMVVCGDYHRPMDKSDITDNPLLVAEVVSKSSALDDRNGKFQKYMTLPSLREYVLLEQNTPQVDVFSLKDDGQWLFATYKGLTAHVKLHALGLTIPMSSIYRDVVFDAGDDHSEEE
jgi:Uma2 family endonuclease